MLRDLTGIKQDEIPNAMAGKDPAGRSGFRDSALKPGPIATKKINRIERTTKHD